MSIESSVESGNLSQSGGGHTGCCNTPFLCFNDCLLLLFCNRLLLLRSFSRDQFFVERVYFSFKTALFRSLCCLRSLHVSGLCHCLLFGNNNSLLFFQGLSGVESSIECVDFCQKSLVTGVTARHTLFFGFNNSLLLLFCNSFLLFRSLCGGVSSVELLHLGFKHSLLGSFCGFCFCGFCHCLLFGNNDSLFFFGGLSGVESSIK